MEDISADAALGVRSETDMGQSILRCPKKGSTTHARFSGSPPPKLHKNAHMSRSPLKLFFCKKSGLETHFGPPTDQYESKGRKFLLKITKKHVQKQLLVVIPVMANFGVPKTTRGRFSIRPYPNPGKKGGLGKLALQLFLHLSARSWTIVTL